MEIHSSIVSTSLIFTMSLLEIRFMCCINSCSCNSVSEEKKVMWSTNRADRELSVTSSWSGLIYVVSLVVHSTFEMKSVWYNWFALSYRWLCSKVQRQQQTPLMLWKQDQLQWSPCRSRCESPYLSNNFLLRMPFNLISLMKIRMHNKHYEDKRNGEVFSPRK